MDPRQEAAAEFCVAGGYGAFSIGKSQIPYTVAYILDQTNHHRRFGFKDELLAFLKKQEIEYDPKYLWD